MSGGAERIREELGRLRIALSDEDLAAIAKLVEANRAGLARVPADAVDEPDVSHGFLPPASPEAGDAAAAHPRR